MPKLTVVVAACILAFATAGQAVRTTECADDSYNTNCFAYAMYKFDPGASSFCTSYHRDASAGCRKWMVRCRPIFYVDLEF